MFVRRNAKPMNVKKINAVKATPKSVEDSGEEAAAGYASRDWSDIRFVYDSPDTYNNNDPRRGDIGHSSRNE